LLTWRSVFYCRLYILLDYRLPERARDTTETVGMAANDSAFQQRLLDVLLLIASDLNTPYPVTVTVNDPRLSDAATALTEILGKRPSGADAVSRVAEELTRTNAALQTLNDRLRDATPTANTLSLTQIEALNKRIDDLINRVDALKETPSKSPNIHLFNLGTLYDRTDGLPK